MADLLLYGTPISPFQRKVETVLREKTLSFDTESVNVIDMPEGFEAISPARRIPVLRDRTVGAEGPAGTLPDSSVICAYLEARFPDPPLLPADPWARARALWFEEYADSELIPVAGGGIFRPIAFPLFTGGAPDLETARRTYAETLPRCYDYLEGALGGRDWLVGDRMTLADVAVASAVAQVFVIAHGPGPERWPGLTAHFERMRARPAFAVNLETVAHMLARRIPDKYDLTTA